MHTPVAGCLCSRLSRWIHRRWRHAKDVDRASESDGSGRAGELGAGGGGRTGGGAVKRLDGTYPENLRIRLTSGELRRWKDAAAAQGCGLSEWVRGLARAALATDRDHDMVARLL